MANDKANGLANVVVSLMVNNRTHSSVLLPGLVANYASVTIMVGIRLFFLFLPLISFDTPV